MIVLFDKPWRGPVIVAAATFALVVFLACEDSVPDTPARSLPNIVLIFADDLGWMDVGYHGADFYETPNIDRFAQDGMVFTAAYAAAGNCRPSRASLLSGRYTPRHGVYAVGDTDRGPNELMRLRSIPGGGFAESERTIAEALKELGYRTGIFGKWHLKARGGVRASEQGFDVVMNPKLDPANVIADPKGVYSITRAASEFMRENRDRPFFAYVSHHAVHTPLQARKSSLEKFAAKPPGALHSDPLYAACTFDLDDSVGLLLAQLDELGLSENTLVVFTSDNGAIGASSQEPLRGNKGSYHEGGIREPFIVRWPGVVEAGTRSDVPIINVDLFPTFLAAAGGEIPAEPSLDGESLLPLLNRTGQLKRESIFWHFPGYLQSAVNRGRDSVFRTRPVSVINKNHAKLLLYHEEWQLDGGREALLSNNAVELYDLAVDPGERRNIAQLDIETRDELLNELLDWFEETGAPLPTQPNPEYQPGG